MAYDIYFWSVDFQPFRYIEKYTLNHIKHAINMQMMHSFSVASFDQCKAVRTSHQINRSRETMLLQVSAHLHG